MTDRPGPDGASTPSGPLFQDTAPGHGPGDNQPGPAPDPHPRPLSDAECARFIATDPLLKDPLPEPDEAMYAYWEQGAADAAAREQADFAQAARIQAFLDRIEQAETGRDTRLQERQLAGWPTRDPGIREWPDDWPDPDSTHYSDSLLWDISAGEALPGDALRSGARGSTPGIPDTLTGPARLAVIRDSVPDLPTAPRPQNRRKNSTTTPPAATGTPGTGTSPTAPAPAGMTSATADMTSATADMDADATRPEPVWSPVACAEALAGLDPAVLADNDVLDFIHAANRLAAFARAVEAQALAVFSSRRPPLDGEKPRSTRPEESRWAAAEIMALYAINQTPAQHRLDDAVNLTRHLPATTALYRGGLLDEIRVKAIHAGLLNVPESLWGMLEPLFLPGASRLNPATLTRKIRALAQKHNPEPLTARHERAATQRGVWFKPLPDGMAMLGATLPAIPAKALYDTLEAWADTAQRDANQPGGTPSTALTPSGKPSRSHNNYLADAYLDLLHQAFLHPPKTRTCDRDRTCDGDCSDSKGRNGANTGTGSARPAPAPGTRPWSWVTATVSITVPALTALGKSEEPGWLEGCGPIPPEQARELAGGAKSWIRILTHPETGARASVGRRRYKPPRDIDRETRLRNPICTGIGCDRPAKDCELDHTIPFHQNRYSPDGTLLPKGDTSVENLLPRSKYCHLLKDTPTTGWTVEPDGPGKTKTTTPTGRTYYNHQEDPAPF